MTSSVSRLLRFIILVGLFFVLPTTMVNAAITNLQIDITYVPQCSDGGDNDGDTLIDYPNDPDCSSITDETESGTGANPRSSRTGTTRRRSSLNGSSPTPMVTAPTEEFVSVVQSGMTVVGTAPGGVSLQLIEGGRIIAEALSIGREFVLSVEDIESGRHDFQVKTIQSGFNSPQVVNFSLVVTSGSIINVSGVDVGVLQKIITDGDIQRLEIQGKPGERVLAQSVGSSEIENVITLDNKGQGAIILDRGTQGLVIATFVVDENGAKLTLPNVVIVPFMEEGEVFANPCMTGDLNNDNRVNIADFGIAKLWQDKNLSLFMTEKESSCLNGDNNIDIIDFHLIALNWTG